MRDVQLYVKIYVRAPSDNVDDGRWCVAFLHLVSKVNCWIFNTMTCFLKLYWYRAILNTIPTLYLNYLQVDFSRGETRLSYKRDSQKIHNFCASYLQSCQIFVAFITIRYVYEEDIITVRIKWQIQFYFYFSRCTISLPYLTLPLEFYVPVLRLGRRHDGT